MADTELTLDVGQANEFKLACRKAGWTNADIKQLCEGNLLARVLPVVRGQAKIEMVKHLVDCATDPTIPQGYSWTVEHHDTSLGQLELDLSKIELYLSRKQRGVNYIEGNKLHKELQGLKDKIVLNANVLDYLLAHPELIPDSWKGKAVFFWGTIYRNSVDDLLVRYLRWRSVGWRWRYRWLDGAWHSDLPAAVLASK